jgi:hypothetical protein
MPEPETNESRSPDGVRWVTLDENSKYAYIAGFLEGMFLGYCFTTWGLPGSEGDDSAYRCASRSYNENWNRFVSSATYRSFLNGLDRLYGDEQNRKIAIRHGMWIVMNRASGKGETIMNTMIESFREEAEEPIESKSGALRHYSKGSNLVN